MLWNGLGLIEEPEPVVEEEESSVPDEAYDATLSTELA